MNTESEIVSEFLNAMRSAGVNIDTGSCGGGHPVADGKVHRADAIGQPRKKHVWYVLHLDAPSSGAFGDYKLGIQDTWTIKKDVKSLTAEERAALKSRMEETKRQRAEEREKLNAEAAEVASRLVTASVKAQPDHGYLTKKGLPVFPGLRLLSKSVKYSIDGEEKTARAGNLLVPMFHSVEDGPKLVGVQFISPDGTKRYLKGMAKEGAYHSIGKKPEEGADICLAEGYATAARIHDATGKLTVAAFDSGNLKPVALAMRAKYPTSRIIVCADNDRFTVKPVENPGVTKAREAADAVRGVIVIPQFEDGEEEKTDFDDLAQLRGLEAVREAIDAVLNPPLPSDEPPPHDTVPDGVEYEADLEGDYVAADGGIDVARGVSIDGAGPRPLGHDEGVCFYWVEARGQVAAISATGHTKSALLAIAPLQWWEMEYPGRGGCSWDMAANAMIRACEAEGVFDPSRKVGRGVILDRERVVVHLGDRLIVDGEAHGLNLPESSWLYTKRHSINYGEPKPLSTAEARKFCDLLCRLRWAEPDMGRMLAGWLATSGICGSLGWRSHMWITGERGSGKSYVVEEIAGKAIGPFGVPVQGDTTEAGVRQALKGDILPVIFDEFEAKSEEDRRRIAKVMNLARQASSPNGAPIIKGGAGGASTSYRVRSSFLFASIDKSGTLPADESRIITLSLLGNDPDEGDEERIARATAFAVLARDVREVITADFANRLFARSLSLVNVIRANAETFAIAIGKMTGSRRLGDTLGGPLAGWLSLHTTQLISEEVATERLKSWHWLGGAIARGATAADHEAALSHLLQSTLRLDGGMQRTVGELIDLVIGGQDMGGEKHMVLKRHGLKVETPEEPGAGNALLVSNRHAALTALFAGQPFTVATLRQHPAATPCDKTVRFDSREKVRALRIDLTKTEYGDS